MVAKVKYYPDHNSYRGPDGRFMSESDVTKLGDAVEVETVRKVDEPVKAEWVSERPIQKDTKGTDQVKNLNNVPRIDEIEVNFNYKTKLDSEEFARQLRDQEKGMKKVLTVIINEL